MDQTLRLNREDVSKLPFPLKFHYIDVPKVDLGYVPWHWHSEIEINMVLEGELLFFVDEKQFHLKPGDGYFVNSDVLHMLRPPENCPDINIGCIFSENILAEKRSLIYQKFVKPIYGAAAYPFIILRREVPWQRDILECLKKMYQVLLEDRNGKELVVRMLLEQMWLRIFEHNNELYVKEQDSVLTAQDQRVKEMCGFINAHFQEPLELSKIAAEAHISVREAIRCFNNILSMTPHQYLQERRLAAAKYLLTNTQLPIIDIAMQSGFNYSSYFSKIFRRNIGMSPNEYRKKLK